MKEILLLPYPSSPLTIAYQKQKTTIARMETKKDQSIVRVSDTVLFYSPQINMPPEPAGYIKVGKYDHY